ncbi:MAG: PIG-L family deacetylase [Terracoccus sp.]
MHVLTATLGEEGEVIPPDLRHLEGAAGDPLGPYRHGELTEALRRLGVTGHVLGAKAGRLSRYRDSGMVGSAAAARPEAFAGASLDEAGQLVAEVVRELRPDVVVTYDRFGGYEHPDHVQTHRVTRAGLSALSDEDLPGRTFEILTPLSWARDDRAFVRSLASSASGPVGMSLTLPAVDAPFPRSVVADEQVTHAVHDVAARTVKNDALRAHATQVLVVSDDVFALSNLIAARSSDREGFRRVDPRSWMPVGELVGERPGLLD